MSNFFCVSIRYLDGSFHGRADYGEPEWPPSPLRVFQALVAASAARWNERRSVRHAAPALRWLEGLPNPTILVPLQNCFEAKGYRLFVPDNVGDLVGRSWSRGGEASMASYRSEKTVRPSLFPGMEAFYYLWPLANSDEGQTNYHDILLTAVRSITHLGWGVDLVVADASIVTDVDAAALKGERFRPTNEETGCRLRVPKCGTLADLDARHHAFLNRVNKDGFSPVPPLAAYGNSFYRRDSEAPCFPYSVFALRQLDDAGFRPFDTARRGLHVSGMLRHAASQPEFARSVGWSDGEVNSTILGHGEASGQQHQPVKQGRILFVPLPSIEWRGNQSKYSVGSVRRVLLTITGAVNREVFNRFTLHFHGQELVDAKSGKSVALVSGASKNDAAISRYFEPNFTWATVTPVILPGYDDPRRLRQRLKAENSTTLTVQGKAELLLKLDKRIEFLLRKAICQAGFSEVLARDAAIEWRTAGFWPGTETASQYAVPDHHRRYRRLHVQILWRSPDGTPTKVPGPICLGGGRYSGLGLFAGRDTAT